MPKITQQMTVNSHTLRYTEHGRAMPFTIASGLVLTTLALVALRALGVAYIQTWVTLLPGLYVVAAYTLYFITRNATHEAIRLAVVDQLLDIEQGEIAVKQVTA